MVLFIMYLKRLLKKSHVHLSVCADLVSGQILLSFMGIQSNFTELKSNAWFITFISQVLSLWSKSSIKGEGINTDIILKQLIALNQILVNEFDLCEKAQVCSAIGNYQTPCSGLFHNWSPIK